MAEELAEIAPDSIWIAIKKGDKKVAKDYLQKLGFELLMGNELDRSDRIRLGWAVMQLKTDPVAFLGFARRGPSSTQTVEKLRVWEEVKIEKDRLREVGQKQVNAYANVANNIDLSEDMVKKTYEEIQRLLKQQEAESDSLSKGIASLIK